MPARPMPVQIPRRSWFRRTTSWLTSLAHRDVVCSAHDRLTHDQLRVSEQLCSIENRGTIAREPFEIRGPRSGEELRCRGDVACHERAYRQYPVGQNAERHLRVVQHDHLVAIG